MSQGKLNAIPPGTGGVAGQLANSKTADAIAQQGQAPSMSGPPLGTLPGTFGRPGGSVQQPTLGQFDSIGAAAPVAMPESGQGISDLRSRTIPGLNPNDPGLFGQPGVQMGTMNDKRYRVGGGAIDPGAFDMALPGNMMYTGSGVNTPAPEDELDGIGGPDSQGQGY